ncbi:phenoloxidase-activating factor 1-like isoform X2 [Macrobrachium nipponense]
MRAILLLPVLALLTRTHAHLGSCEDHFFECPTWQYFGRCDTHLEFMAKNCPHSCNVCVDPGCFDRNHLCGAWTQQGFCRTSRQVQAACPHSCDICQLPESLLPKTITKPDFDCGRPVSSSFIRGKRQIIFPGEPGYSVSQREQQIGRLTVPAPIGIEGRTPLRISVNDAFCGATIIHERFLITAAHCVFSQERPPIMVRVGELDFSSDNEARSRPADYRVKRVIVHPKFKRNSLERYNDIAIIETVDKMQFNDVVFPLCLSDRRPSVGSIATGSGFGLVNQTHRSTHAQEADLRILDSRLCEARYASEGLVTLSGTSILGSYRHPTLSVLPFPVQMPARAIQGDPCTRTPTGGVT